MSGCSGGCGGNKAAPQADLAGKATINYSITAQMQFHPCADCAKDGAKPFALGFQVTTGFSQGEEHEKKVKYALVGLEAAVAAAKAAHEAH